jgi:hypothetical protein
MKKIAVLALAIMALPTVGFAQNLARHSNLEPACSASGSGMDPRCVGDTLPGTESDALSTRQARAFDAHGMTPAQVRVQR